MKKINFLIRFFTSATILLASMAVFSACTSDDPKPVQTITGFSPTSAVQGTTVVITGTNFSTTASSNVVSFNGAAAIVTAATATQITTTVPLGATTGKITVQIGAVIASSTGDYLYIPTITVSTIAGSGVAGLADGTGIGAKLQYPTGVVVDASGNLFVAEMDNNIIRKITPAGVTSIFAGSTSGDVGTADGTGTAARFGGPYGLAIDASGNLYVADIRNHRIRKITSAGVVTTIAGSSDGFADGNGVAAKFYYPSGVALDASGTLYVTDQGNQRIRKITSNGDVSTLAGSATRGFADGTGTAAAFNNPNGLAVDASGNIYVADYNNNRIRKITAGGVVTTLAGSSVGFADGIGTDAKFDSPAGVTVDASGNVYVAERNNNRVRKITSGGVVTTLAGSSSGFADGIGTVAKFNSLQGISVSTSGDIYVADSDNNRVRKIKIQ